MPTQTVEAVIEKALRTAPSATAGDKPNESQAPTATPKAEASSSKEPSETTERTAFEEELFGELEADEQVEFDGLTPTEQRSRLDWMKRRYRRDARQRTDEGKLRKAWGALQEAGVTAEDLRQLVAKRKGATTTSEQTKTEAAIKRGFERKLDKAETAEEREAIQEARQTVLEEIEVREAQSPLAKRLQTLEERFEVSDRRTTESRRKVLEQEINDLEEKEGFKASLVETYREDIRALGVRHSDWSAWKLLHYLATEEELKTGRRNGPPPKETPRATPVVKKSAPVTSTSQPARRFSLEKAIEGIIRRKGA